jgi:glycine betaine/proline transport system substrate-binding protein
MGVQAWPGVVVKSEVAAELMQALGYKVKQTQMDTPFVLHGLASGDLDIGLGGWYPVSAAMITPMVKKGKLVRLAANLPDALSGMAVPVYVHKAGVNSVQDLHRYSDRFDSKIYGIEGGSTWNTQVKQAIQADRFHLKGWQVVGSSTAVMLTQVKRAISKHQWIVFYGWKPHWMNIVYHLYYLKGPKGSPIVHTKATVYTLAANSFAPSHPNLARFFRQYRVNAKTQSHWIYQYSRKRQPDDKVARQWIASHLKQVRSWLKGVTTKAGNKPAFQAVRATYGG